MIANKKKDLSGKNFCRPSKKRIPHNDNIPTIFDSERHALDVLYSIEESDDDYDKFIDVSINNIDFYQ